VTRVGGAYYFGGRKKGSCREDGSRWGSGIGSGETTQWRSGCHGGGDGLGSEEKEAENGGGGVEVRTLYDEGGKSSDEPARFSVPFLLPIRSGICIRSARDADVPLFTATFCNTSAIIGDHTHTRRPPTRCSSYC
jgi:hypothetical protein